MYAVQWGVKESESVKIVYDVKSYYFSTPTSSGDNECIRTLKGKKNEALGGNGVHK